MRRATRRTTTRSSCGACCWAADPAPSAGAVQRRKIAMKLYVDSADIGQIRELAATGLLDGVTTNPSLVGKSGRPINDVIAEICEAVDGPVSAEVTASDFDGMVRQGVALAAVAANVAVKVPATWDGFKACRALSQR